jgi:type IV fimbrial biogenesis protein FimT
MLTRRANRVAGFTMLEMAVTMGIFALLVALGVPTMRTWIANTRVRAVADGLQNGVRLAQAESLRRSRQVVFSLTTNAAPQAGFTAVANGTNWSINTIPSMTDGTELAAFVDSGVLAATNASVTVTGPAEICFNSVGRLVPNAATGVAGSNCTLPTTTPPVWPYDITDPGADHALRVQVGLSGQVHLCDPHKTLSPTDPDGC